MIARLACTQAFCLAQASEVFSWDNLQSISNALCVVFSNTKIMQTHESRSLDWTLKAADRLRAIFQCTCAVPSQSIFLAAARFCETSVGAG